MIPKHHIILGAITTLIIYLIFPITFMQTIIIFLSSFLIDFDHYLYYAFKKNNFNPIKSIKWFFTKRKKWLALSYKNRKKYKRPILIFHGIEFLITLFLFSYINQIFLFILIGILIHIFLDYLEIIFLKEPFYTKLSPLLVLIKNKNKQDFLS